MKIWKLSYELQDDFSSPVTGHVYSLRMVPRDMASQKIRDLKYSVSPCSAVSRGRDSFENSLLTGCVEEPHHRFLVRVESVVVVENIPEPEERGSWQLGMFRYGTELTETGPNLDAFYKSLPSRGGEDDWTRAGHLMEMVADSFRYESGSTDVSTTAEQAFSQGCGVCQDYSHILLALLRKEGMTARYVAGAIPGEGQTHAWTEVYQNGLWKGFDPTNRCLADDGYIRLALGRDARDCSLNRGIFRGNASQAQKVSVKMEEEI